MFGHVPRETSEELLGNIFQFWSRFFNNQKGVLTPYVLYITLLSMCMIVCFNADAL